MDLIERASVREDLERQIAAIKRDCPPPLAAPKPPAAPMEVLVDEGEEMVLREPFGRWLVAQQDRGDWIDDLAGAARADRGFPKEGTPTDVRKRLQALGADGDAFEQVDDAERMWRSQ